MKNTRENAEKFIWDFGRGKSFVDRLQGVPDFVDLLTEWGGKVANQHIPNDAHLLEVFDIKDSEDSPTGEQAFIGFKLDNGDFHFIGVPYTGNKLYSKRVKREKSIDIALEYYGLSVIIRTEEEFNHIKSFLGPDILYIDWVPQMSTKPTGIVIWSILDEYGRGSIGCAESQSEKFIRLVEFNDYFKLDK
jgi:hypothetical protein